jgi:phage gp46-like protein
VSDLAFDFTQLEKTDFSTTDGIEIAIALSLFTDRRHENEGGWWGHTFGVFGSRLWLLRRAKLRPEVEDEAKRYAEEALGWLLDAGLVRELAVRVERRPAGLAIAVDYTPVDAVSQLATYEGFLRWWE